MLKMVRQITLSKHQEIFDENYILQKTKIQRLNINIILQMVFLLVVGTNVNGRMSRNN